MGGGLPSGGLSSVPSIVLFLFRSISPSVTLTQYVVYIYISSF